MANQPSAELLEALQAALGPKGFSRDADDMAPWLVDWRRRYRGTAAAMLSPASVDEVQSVVRLCGEAHVPLTPQGGNTSMVGGATPPADGSALLLSLRRLDRIRGMDANAGIAVAEAGVILENLHGAAQQHGLRFPLTLGARGSATIGGLVSTNAGGTQVLRFGTMRALTLGVEAVLPDGSLYEALAPLKKDNRGYDLKQLLIGGEGTLGIVTAATLKLVPLAAHRAVAWVGLSSPHAALALLRHMQDRIGDALEGFELVPAHVLDLVLAHVPGTRAPLSGSHAWHVLIETAAAKDTLTVALERALDEQLIEDAAIAGNEAQADAFWRLRDSIAEAERAEGPGAKHDVSVPVAAMPDFILSTARAVEERFPGVRPIAFGHLGDGNVHFNVAAPPGASPDWPVTEGLAVTRMAHDLVIAAGGSISAEHGIGQMRLGELARLESPARLSTMRAIKAALDPAGLFNPGKLVPLAETNP